MSAGRNQDKGRGGKRKDEEFIQDVLSRTSGSACERAAGLLPDLTDDALEEMDRRLVQSHLEHCSVCRTLAVTLGWLEPLLPKMAFLDPGPEFTSQVLAQTSLAAPGVAAGPITEPVISGPAGLMHRLGKWWQQQILRPVFPLQVAYVATVIIVLLVATPFSPFKKAPDQLLQTVIAGPESLPVIGPMLDLATNDASEWVEGRVDRASENVRSKASGSWKKADSSLMARVARTDPARQLMKSQLGDLGGNISNGKLGDASYDLFRVLKSGRRVWVLWWNEETIVESTIERSMP